MHLRGGIRAALVARRGSRDLLQHLQQPQQHATTAAAGTALTLVTLHLLRGRFPSKTRPTARGPDVYCGHRNVAVQQRASLFSAARANTRGDSASRNINRVLMTRTERLINKRLAFSSFFLSPFEARSRPE